MRMGAGFLPGSRRNTSLSSLPARQVDGLHGRCTRFCKFNDNAYFKQTCVQFENMNKYNFKRFQLPFLSALKIDNYCKEAVLVVYESYIIDMHQKVVFLFSLLFAVILAGSASLRKSEQACNDFGPGIKRKVFPSTYVLPREYQHNVMLGYEKEPKRDEIEWNSCGGFLISENYVITAAHCIYSSYRGSPKIVRLGNIDLTGAEDEAKPQDIPILFVAAHPDFSTTKKTGDIALLKLAESVKFTKYVQPVCLYPKDDVPVSMISTGWAILDSGDRSVNDLLRKSSVIHVDQENCNQTYRGEVQDSNFCGFTDTSICYLLSGSPAFIPNVEDSRVMVVGFTSYGTGCGHRKPNIYIKISSYLDWIESVVWP